jgi:hypothetical protein
MVRVNAANEQVQMAVVVVIADGDAVREAGARKSRSLGNVPEISFAIVFEEPIRVFGRSFDQGMNVSPIREKNVEVAVVVVIKQANAARHRFRSVPLPRFAAIELEINRTVSEVDG